MHTKKNLGQFLIISTLFLLLVMLSNGHEIAFFFFNSWLKDYNRPRKKEIIARTDLLIAVFIITLNFGARWPYFKFPPDVLLPLNVTY